MILDPISIATSGYIYTSSPFPIPIATHGYVIPDGDVPTVVQGRTVGAGSSNITVQYRKEKIDELLTDENLALIAITIINRLDE